MIYTLLVLFCSFLYGVSAVLCKYGLQHNVDLRTYSLKNLLMFLGTNRIWVAGVLLSFATNIAIVELQSFIDVSVVYPILNFSYIFALVLGGLFLNEVLTRHQWLGVMTIVLGTSLIIFIENPQTGEGTNTARLLVLTMLSVGVIGALILAVRIKKVINYELFYAVCTGISFGNVETYIKANTNLVTDRIGYFTIFSLDSVVEFMTLWPFLLLLAFALVGWVCMQITYSHGNVSITVPMFAVIQSCVTFSSGYFIFGEHYSPWKLIGVITIISGVVMLISSTIHLKEDPHTV
jgi:drug/metabolite transporter (DMT)-like permease